MAHWYPRYVPVGVRRARALRERLSLRSRGVEVQPVDIRGRVIARSFWGRRWCEHLESFSDFENRLPRGRTYVRNGAVYHLAIAPGEVEARVAGSDLYRVTVGIRTLGRPAWKAIKAACAGQIGSVLELLQGRLSDHVMEVVTDRDTGLFPKPGEMDLACDCPDRATMCKHVAAVLYGVGSRLDGRPELLFRLRGVDEAELIAADLTLPGGTATADTLEDGDLGDIFGIELDAEPAAPTSSATPPETPARVPTATPPRAVPNATPQQTATPTGAAIAELRAWCGFSVAEFARLLQVSAATVRRWEAVPGPLTLRARTREALTELRREAGDPEP
ncbi:MAG: SWIM zinc finger family protein [Acidobacteria bacterium]|nr:SWIM zinc finger family protein [Acidobacteriota bacterium]